jgi:acetyltransferase-like isoleucine patch superfamily enzyme
MRTIALAFIRMTGSWIRRLARAYGLRVDEHCVPLGQHPLIVEDSPEQARAHIPRTVMFNTRSGQIRVGTNTVFGEEVMVLTGKHQHFGDRGAALADHQQVPESGRDITIGTGCYIGSRALLIGPLTVGDFAVVGAGAVVTHDVPPYAMVAGVPARIVKTFT